MQLMAASILFWSAWLLELCWLSAWATFVWAGFLDRTFPLPDMLVCAAAAALFVRVSAALRLRNVHALGLHAACVAGCWWLALQRQQADSQTLSVLLALTTAACWTSGALHGRRVLDHRIVCARFDFGMYWLLALLGARLLLRGQADVPQQAQLTDALVPSFFVSALCAICVSRYRSQVSKQWLRVSGRIVMLFGGLVALAALGFSVAWMCRPYLRSIAETTHTGAAAVARPIANAGAELIFAVMREGAKHPMPLYIPGRMPTPYPGRRSWPEEPLDVVPVDQTSLTALGVAAGCMALLGAGFWLWWKRHWLLANQSVDAPSHELWALCRQLWHRALAWLRGLRSNTEAEPVRLLHALLTWGERSGVARVDTETPLEYARRLKHSFAALSGEIDRIVDNHCRQTYALTPCEDRELAQARRALRQLRSPRLWWARSVGKWRATHSRQPSWRA
jgi:hypothetical protein